jgi:hypothetical protein
MQVTADGEWEAELDRLLGPKLLFDLDEPQQLGGPSVPSIYRYKALGLINFVKSGGRSKLNRPTMKRVMRGVTLTPA